MSKQITTIEAAEILKVTRARIHQLVTSGRLPATKIGRDWMINPKDLAAVKNRKPGRPKTREK